MFCASLRRRPSFASGVATLTSALFLREHRLDTHDLELPLGSGIDPDTGNTTNARRLRVLMLAPSAVSEDRLQTTVKRIAHFASLTGGEDVAIIFLLSTAATTTFTTAAKIANGTETRTTDGIFAHSKLKAELLSHTEIPHVPILPISMSDGIPDLLKRHIANLSRPSLERKPCATAFELLQLCTTAPPMSQQTAFILTDLFADLRDLAITCTAISSLPTSSSPLARMGTQLSDLYGPTAAGKLKHLRDLVGDEECRNIVDFWKEEWVAD